MRTPTSNHHFKAKIVGIIHKINCNSHVTSSQALSYMVATGH